MIDYGRDEPVHRQLANILRRQIETGELAPRTPIPSKRLLRQQYGVAGSTIDKTMKVLKDEGLIRPVKGMGLYVVPPEEREER